MPPSARQQPEHPAPRSVPKARPSLEERLAETLKDIAPRGRRPVQRVTAEVTYRQPHLMFGNDGYSIVSNEFLWSVLARALAAKLLTVTEASVFAYLMGKQKQASVTVRRQQDIADELRLPRTNVSSALTRLESFGWILRTSRTTYQVNMTVIYRGNGDAQQATLFEAEALRTNPQDFPDLVMPTPRRRKQEAEHDHAE